MAEPVRKSTDLELLDEEPGITLQRWVEGPGGRMELVEMPLTPERFLNPQVGDHMTQGKRHGDTAREIADQLSQFFRPAPDVLAEGRFLSETTGLWFQVSPDGSRVRIFEHPSGRPLLTREEAESLRKVAEERALAESEARRAAEERERAAEDEIGRLRAELDRLRKASTPVA